VIDRTNLGDGIVDIPADISGHRVGKRDHSIGRWQNKFLQQEPPAVDTPAVDVRHGVIFDIVQDRHLSETAPDGDGQVGVEQNVHAILFGHLRYDHLIPAGLEGCKRPHLQQHARSPFD
jgi:hypothetical protein